MAKQPAGICTACGGSGVTFEQWGPFYSAVQKRWRETVADHTETRHEVFRNVDRMIAAQVIPLAKAMAKKDVSATDILVEIDKASGDALKAQEKGDPVGIVRALLKMTMSAVYLLESLEIEMKRAKQQD